MHILELIFSGIHPSKTASVVPVLTVTNAENEVELKEFLVFNSASQRLVGLSPGTYTLTVKAVETFTTEFEVPEIDDTIITVEAPASIVYSPEPEESEEE
jgi:hypothetical protein